MKKLALLLLATLTLSAADIRIAAGAGYKKVTLELLDSFANKDKIEAIFGNMQQVTAQAKSQDIALIIGDKSFLDKTDLVKFGEQKVGNGKLVIIYPKGKEVKNILDLNSSDVKKVAIPDAKKAIYGIAGTQALKSANLDIQDKLLFVSTVPQAASYVLTGEVDAGLVNLSEALVLKDKIGGITEVDQSLYKKIQITAIKLESCIKFAVCDEFLDYLKSQKAKEIITKHGL